MKYCILFIAAATVFASCTQKNKAVDNPAYHNPTVQPLTDSIAAAPGNAGLYFKRSVALSEVNEDSLALIDLSKAHDLDTNNTLYLNSIGFVEMSLKHTDKAVAAFNQSLRLRPGNTDIQMALANAYINVRQTEKAQQIIRSVLQASPGNPKALLLSAQLLAAQKDTTAAITALQTLLEKEPANRDASLQLADWYNATNNPAVVRQYEKTFRMDSTDATPLFEIGKYYQKNNQPEEAKHYYEQCFLTDRYYTYAYVYSAQILMRQDSFQKAQRLLHIATSVDINNPEVWYYTGLCFEQMKQADSAKYYYRQAAGFGYDAPTITAALKRLR